MTSDAAHSAGRHGVAGRTVVLAGATSAAGHAAAAALCAAGARVIATGRSAARLAALAQEVPGVRTEQRDATVTEEMEDLAARLALTGGVDGVIPLVGGWRGGGGLHGQSDADYRALEVAFTAVRTTSRAFDGLLRDSAAGRFAIVSSTAVTRPRPGGANYVSVKAASEIWTHAVAHGFAAQGQTREGTLRTAATAIRAGRLNPSELAAAIVGLWDADATSLNGSVVTLPS